MEITTNLTRTGTSAWAGFDMPSKHRQQGITLPMGRLADAPFAGYAAALAVVPTAVRTADAKVPDPRGRQR